MRISLVNHAALIVEVGEIKLLCDPWITGRAFGEGWGLRFDNPQTQREISTCTHLWISHFHSDHFHVPSLKLILEQNPAIIALGNRSLNFDMSKVLEKIGFRNVIAFGERTRLELAPNFAVTRFPASGIDNMLLIETSEGRVLNYNDCLIPERSMRMLAKTLGQIDLLCANFNHAGKLLHQTLPPTEQIKATLKETLGTAIRVFNPTHVVPFASYHYYCTPETADQNPTMLKVEEILAVDSRILPLHVGGQVIFADGRAQTTPPSQSIVEVALTTKTRTLSYAASALQNDAATYCAKLRRGYPILWRMFPPFVMQVSDLGQTFELALDRGLVSAPANSQPEITAHSEEVHKWLTTPYGANTFLIGAHLRITAPVISAFTKHIFAAVAMENHLSVFSLLAMLCTPRGIQFLFNRREEILGILLGGRSFLKKKAGALKPRESADAPLVEEYEEPRLHRRL